MIMQPELSAALVWSRQKLQVRERPQQLQGLVGCPGCTEFTITPHISERDYLRVEYKISLDSFGAKADPDLPPSKNTNKIESEATVPNGATIVVGGLQVSSETESVSKVPILGDIPILGFAFRNTIVRKQYRTTYLFITPVIMQSDNFDDLKEASVRELGKIEDALEGSVDGDSKPSQSISPQ